MKEVEQLALGGLDERYAKLRLQRPELVAAVRRSVEREGVLHPLVANRTAEGTLVLLDGFKRLHVLRELGHDEAPVRIVALSDAQAQAAILAYNLPHRGLCELEEAWIVRSLVRVCQLRQKQVAELVGRHKSWVCRRLLLAERLVDTLQQDMRLGLCSATVARELVRLPRGNQAQVGEVVRQHGLTTRQCAALVDLCLSADGPKALQAVLDDPLRYIGVGLERPERPASRDPRLSERGDAVRIRLVRFERGAVDLCHVLRQHPPAALGAVDLEILGDMAGPVRDRGTQADRQLDEMLKAARGSDA